MSTEPGSSMPQRIKAIFLAAHELPADERSSFLEERCGGDAELRRQVEVLLEDAAKLPTEFLVGSNDGPTEMWRSGSRGSSATIGSCGPWARAAWARSSRPNRTLLGGMWL